MSKKKGFSSIWTMFSTISRHNDKNQKICNRSLRFLNLKTKLNNSYWFVFNCLFCSSGLSKFYECFLGQIALCQHFSSFSVEIKHTNHSPFHGFWQSFVTIGSCNHHIRIISTYVGNTKKSEIS